MQLALLNDERGAYEAAIQGYRQVLATHPSNVTALNNLAYGLAVRQNNPKEALPLAVKATTLAPNQPTILDTLAWIHHLLGNNQEALRYLQQAIRIGTNNGEIYFHAAVVHERLGARAEAETALKRALDLDAGLGIREDVRELQRVLRGK
jgi:tetratricopeptide (TPR) repeat protein